MNLSVTQDNLYLLLPSKVSRMTGMLVDGGSIDVVGAVEAVYASDTYRRLEREDAKLWHLGPVALYEEMMQETVEG